MSSAKSESFSFLFHLDSFYFFFFSAVARTSIIMLNNSGERQGEHLSYSWSSGERVQFFTIENNVCCRLIICWGFYYVEVGSFHAHFLKSFNHKSVLNFVKGFLCIYWDVFIFQFVNIVYHIDLFVYIEEF